MMVAALAAALAAVPANGIDEEPRRGTYVETSLGVFSAMGGSEPFSKLQPSLGLTLGRQVGARAALFASLGIGAASASCYQIAPDTGACAAADSFGATFLEGGAAYGMALGRRSSLSFKALAGFTDLSPGPVRNGASVPAHLAGFHLGGGAALDYDTRLDHFAVGVDALLRYTLARYTLAGGGTRTLGLPSLALLPRVRYVF